jgi:hypothetical protein
MKKRHKGVKKPSDFPDEKKLIVSPSKSNFPGNNKLYLGLSGAIIFFAFLILSPLLNSGYINDDNINSLINGFLFYYNQTILQYVSNTLALGAGGGRYYPLGLYVYLLDSLVTNVVLYKGIILCSVLISMILFGYFVYLLTHSKTIGMISLLFPTIFFQFRLYHDPILGYFAFLETLFILLLLSLIFLMKYLTSLKPGHLMASILFYLLCLLTYDISYPFFIIHVALVYRYSDAGDLRQILKRSSPYILLSGIFLSFIAISRLYYGYKLIGGAGGDPYIPNPDIFAFLVTLAKQLFASIPLSYFFMNLRAFTGEFSTLSGDSLVLLAFIGISFFILFYLLFKRFFGGDDPLEDAGATGKNLLITGVAITLSPLLFVSASPKYQAELTWGLGYLPIYISYFGVILMVLAGLILISGKIGSVKKGSVACILLLTIVCSSIGTITYLDNRIIVNRWDITFLYPRNFVGAAMERGIFNGVPDGSVLLVDAYYLHDVPAFYRMWSPLNWSYIGVTDRVSPWGGRGFATREVTDPPGEGIYYLTYHSLSQASGYLLFGKVNTLKSTNTSIGNVTSSDFSIYLQDDDLRDPAPQVNNVLPQRKSISVNGFWKDASRNGPFERFRLGEGPIMVLEGGGREWRLYHVSSGQQDIDLHSLDINIVTEYREINYN